MRRRNSPDNVRILRVGGSSHLRLARPSMLRRRLACPELPYQSKPPQVQSRMHREAMPRRAPQ
eukprot:5072319-Prorocentrum_lima.AAC.1